MSLLDLSLLTWLIILAALVALLILLALQRRWPAVRNIAGGLLISTITILIFAGAGEIYFRYFHADSGWSFTLAHQNWNERYWQENDMGFRDRQWEAQDLIDRTVMVVLGDSFASGWGVNDPANRFADVLAADLGPDYAVVNLARPGMSTRSQRAMLEEFELAKPEIVLLQYFLNDIEDASASVSRFWEAAFPETPPLLVQESYLVNQIYWTFYPLTQSVNTTFEGSYWDWQYETYDNFDIWSIHRQEIEDLIDSVEALDAELYVVIFPNMDDPVRSIPYVDRVRFVFEERGYADHVMTLYDEVAAWDQPEDATASPRDAHPSAAFHRFTGELLYERFFAN